MSRDTNKRVIDVLNDVLTGELTAINQYFLHAEMCKNWGYMYLYKYIRKESIDEMRHAEWVMERVLYLNGIPNMQRLNKLNIGETVVEQFRSDLALEYEAVDRLEAGIKVCGEESDHGSRDLLERILHSEEEHIDWLEAQIELVKQVGEQNYLAQQIHPREE